jgi:drug/metabolite transporter (DMT)-like permease
MRTLLNHFASDNAYGIALIICASAFAVASSSLTKILSADFSSMQIAFVRVCVTLVALLPFLWRSHFRGLWPARPTLMIFRSINAGIIIVLNIYAVGHMPLVDFTAISFTTPLFVILLSFAVFRQVPQMQRTVATFIGFAGVLLIVRPTGDVSWALGAALGGAFCLGLGVLLVRLLSRTESQLRLLLWSNAIVALFLAIPALDMWSAPTLQLWGLLVVAGLMGAMTQACILLAYERGEPMVIAPFDYSRILLAVGAGFLLFGEVPDVLTFCGAALIIAAGIYIARRKAPPAATDAPPATTKA